jgi:hypothetical protein
MYLWMTTSIPCGPKQGKGGRNQFVYSGTNDSLRFGRGSPCESPETLVKEILEFKLKYRKSPTAHCLRACAFAHALCFRYIICRFVNKRKS